MAEKHKAKEKYLWSYVDSGVSEEQDSSQPACVICGEKWDIDSRKPSKIKQHQEIKQP